MPRNGSAFSYSALTHKGIAAPGIAMRADVANLLNGKYEEVYLYLMDLYDVVSDDIWPEEPSQNEEFIQLCCFIQVLEEMASLTLRMANYQVADANNTTTINTMTRKIMALERDNAELRARIDFSNKVAEDELRYPYPDISPPLSLAEMIRQIEAMTGARIPTIPNPNLSANILRQQQLIDQIDQIRKDTARNKGKKKP